MELFKKCHDATREGDKGEEQTGHRTDEADPGPNENGPAENG